MCRTPLVLALALAGCVTTTPVQLSLKKPPVEEARREVPGEVLSNLRDFGNVMAAHMLSDYRLHGLTTVGGDYLYRYDATKAGLPKHAYLVFRLSGRPSIGTNAGEKNNILLDGGSFCAVPVDAPAVVNGGTFTLEFTKSGFRQAFNPWCIGAPGTYPEQLFLWFKDPATKDAKMQRMAELLVAAFPGLAYRVAVAE